MSGYHSLRPLRRIIPLLLWLLGALLLEPDPGYAQNVQDGRGAVHILEIRGIINPPSAGYLQRTLADAAAQDARLVVIELDTPGGLETSMREMTQAILASPVPVAVYVSPPGARAASAGLFLLTASHIAAMGPSTNTGAAHPVALGGGETDDTMASKVTNDSAAAIRSLAEMRGRNAEWAEAAVRESVSVTENEALELNVIDLVARDLDHLLEQIHGRTVQTAAGERTLDVANAPRAQLPMNFAESFLHVISNPDIAFILLSLGTIGLIAELYFSPGTFISGVAGAILLILAFFALGNLPTNWAGVALIVLAVGLLVAELNTAATGVLGTGAVVAFLLGGLLLFRPLRTPSPVLPELSVNPWLLGGITLIMAAFTLLVIGEVARARKAPLLTGSEQFTGQRATVFEVLAPGGRVRFEGQLWFAVVRPPQIVPVGQEVRITGSDGLTLLVEPTEKTLTMELPAADEQGA
jgi:membrane-bound serine protease (ClpP class)